MNVFEILAEQRIAEAQRRGEFDNLPGAGRPLDLSDDPFVSGEQRMMNHILKNSGCVPPEIGLRREIATLHEALAAMPTGEGRTLARRRLARLLIQLAELRRS